jgi:phage shock protein C
MHCRHRVAHPGGVTPPTEGLIQVTSVHADFRRRGLARPRQERVIAGVCAGLGRRFGLSPWTARILFVLLLMIIPGSQILVYPILWILMPNED